VCVGVFCCLCCVDMKKCVSMCCFECFGASISFRVYLREVQ